MHYYNSLSQGVRVGLRRSSSFNSVGLVICKSRGFMSKHRQLNIVDGEINLKSKFEMVGPTSPKKQIAIISY